MNWMGLTTKEIVVFALVGLAVAICLIYLKKRITKYLKERKERRAQEAQKEMGRGEILIRSIFIELIVVAILCVSPWFLPVSVFWKMLITAGGIFLTSVFNLLLVYFWWASNNLNFTFNPEGMAKHVMAGKAYCKTLIQLKGHDLAKKKSRGVEIGDVIKVPEKTFLGRIMGFVSPLSLIRKHLGGLKFYGIWPFRDILIYNFGWINRAQNGEIEIHPKETMDVVSLKDDVFVIEAKNAEDKDGLHANILLLLTIRVVNPYKVSFVVQNWLETVMNRIAPAVRNEYTKDVYANWISEDKDLADRIMGALRGFLKNECRKRYGVEVRAIEVISIDPGEGYRDLTLMEFTAKQEKKATIVAAQAEAERVELAYKAVEKFGELGKVMKLYETIVESPGKGSKWIIPLPGMIDDLSKVLKGTLSGSKDA